MDERMRFVIRLKDGESMASLCREFGISRKTGYKIFERYEQCGLEGLSDRARRPFRYANQLPDRSKRPSWQPNAKNRTGAHARSASACCVDCRAVKVPAAAPFTPSWIVTAWSARASRSRTRAEGTPLSEGLSPNDLWCTDYKGEFSSAIKRYCYPLTVTDYASRYLLLCEAMESNREKPAFRPLSACSKNAVCRRRSAPTTVFPSLRPTDYSISRSSRCGGCAWASASNASGLAIPSRTAATSACI